MLATVFSTGIPRLTIGPLRSPLQSENLFETGEAYAIVSLGLMIFSDVVRTSIKVLELLFCNSQGLLSVTEKKYFMSVVHFFLCAQ